MKVTFRLIMPIAVVFLLVLMPLIVRSRQVQHVAILFLIFAGLGTSWNLIGGYGGQLSLGHAAFFGAGAYTVSILWAMKGVSFWLALLCGMGVATGISILVGAMAFRLRGPYFALATLALAELLRIVAETWHSLTLGAEGIVTTGLRLRIQFLGADLDLTSKVPFYYFFLVALMVTFAATMYVRHGKVGLQLLAIRDDEDAACSVGVKAGRVKLSVLALSAALTSLIGGIYAPYIGFVAPTNTFGVDRSVEIALVALIGGAAKLLGPIIGSLFVVTISELLRAWLPFSHRLVYGILLIIVVLKMRGGIVGFIEKFIDVRGVRYHDSTRSTG